MKKNKKNSRRMLYLVILLAIAIGFAALSTTLKINGSVSISKGNWNIYWDNIEVVDGSVVSQEPTIGQDEGDFLNTKITWDVLLNLPGDYYEFTIDAVNAGDMDAVITDIQSNAVPELPGYISYSVKYADDTEIVVGDELPKADGDNYTTKKYKVRVEFLDTITPEEMNAVGDDGLLYTLTYNVEYGQKSVNDITKKGPVALKTTSGESITGKTDEELKYYYGAKVEGFNTIYPISWDLFYSDEDYVYLITADYIDRYSVPSEIAVPQTFTCNYTATNGFSKVYDDPRWSSGSASDALKNNPLTKKYLRWVNEYPNSTNNNIKAVAYMMDTSIWANFAGNAEGAFAMGGPTLEMFIKSYNAANILKLEEYDEFRDRDNYSSFSDKLKYGNVSANGYYVKWVDFYCNNFSWTDTITSPYLFNDNEIPNMWNIGNIYTNPSANGQTYYIASPVGYDSNNIYGVNYTGIYNYDTKYQYCQFGFRPLVAIPKSSLK